MNNRQEFTLSNSLLSCTISELGAEIVSLKSKTDRHEYIWQADPNIWAGSAPILFPIVGRLKGGQYTFNNKKYSLPTHGFIRSQCFIIKQRTESSLTLSACANPSTLQSYPFKFQLDVTFLLEHKSLKVSYNVVNQDNKELYFSIGSHPEFALPQTEFSEGKCKLVFSEQEAHYCQLIKNDLLSDEKCPVDLTEKSLRLTPDLFDHDTLIFRDVSSSSITLFVDEKPILSLEMGNNKHLGIWAKPNVPYVCIEPWTATDETMKTPIELKDKPDMMCLSSGEKIQQLLSDKHSRLNTI